MSAGPWQRVIDIVRRQADPDAHGPLADERLLARFAANGDPSAFELLVWRHGGLVLGTCRRQLGDAHLAEDAFQATFLALARKPRAVRSGAALADWLHRVAVRVSVKLRASGARWARNDKSVARNIAVPADDAGRNEWNDIVDDEIDRLPERLRRAVVLCYLDGRTTDEASKLLGCPRGTVLSRLSTARDRLRVRLTRRGVSLPAAGVAALVVTESPAALVPLAVRTALFETPPLFLATVHGVFHAMTISKIKVAAAVVLAIAFAGTGIGWLVVPGPGPSVLQAQDGKKVEGFDGKPIILHFKDGSGRPVALRDPEVVQLGGRAFVRGIVSIDTGDVTRDRGFRGRISFFPVSDLTQLVVVDNAFIPPN